MSLILISIFMHILSPANKLDVRFYYSVIEAQEFFNRLSIQEIRRYFFGELFDLFFILNYSALSFLLFRSYFSKKEKWVLFLPGLIDVVETGSILLKLKGHQISLFLLSLSTLAKWSSGVLVLVFLLYKVLQSRRIDA
jgi:hypothetical protein